MLRRETYFPILRNNLAETPTLGDAIDLEHRTSSPQWARNTKTKKIERESSCFYRRSDEPAEVGGGERRRAGGWPAYKIRYGRVFVIGSVGSCLLVCPTKKSQTPNEPTRLNSSSWSHTPRGKIGCPANQSGDPE